MAAVPWSTVTKPLCDELTLNCFLLSCQLSRPDKVDSSRPKERGGGGLWLHADQGHRTLLPPLLRANPFKGEQTGVSSAELMAQKCTNISSLTGRL